MTEPDKRENDILLSEISSDGILCLTMNNPSRRNALSEEMMQALASELDEAARSPAIRVIVLSAKGSVFCSGHDLKQLAAARQKEDGGKDYYKKIMSQCSRLMQSIVKHPKPIIAQVGRMATAAGCQLVASCDLAIAGKSAHFATPGVHIGLFCSTPMVALSRNVSNKHAMEMLLTGDPVSADRAEQVGLVNKVVEDSDLQAETMAMAAKIASKSAMTLKTGKKAFYEQREMTLEQAYEHASKVMVENMMKHDAKEGINAFLERRDAKWRDK